MSKKNYYDHEKMTMHPIYLSTANNLISIPLTDTDVVQLAVSPEGFATVYVKLVLPAGNTLLVSYLSGLIVTVPIG